MKFSPTPIQGAMLIELEPRSDDRGSFARAFCRREFEEAGIDFEIAQCNLARSHRAGTVRGLHFQVEPALEGKIVRCVAGAILDVLVDVRHDSASHGRWHSVRLDARDRLSIYVPAGVAHGYQTLEDATEVFYMTDQFYSPGSEKGVRFDDPALAIPWPLPPRDVTERDRSWPLLDPKVFSGS